MSTIRPRQKTISRHLLRRRAEFKKSHLENQLLELRSLGNVSMLDDWRAVYKVPEWATKFEVRRAFKKAHYQVVALDR